MGKYLASQIIAGRMTYAQAIATKWGRKYKDDIDATIAERGCMIDDSGACVPKAAEDTGTAG